MKNLFLASVARNTIDKFVEILDKPCSAYTIAFIPTAGSIYADNWFVTEDRNALVSLGSKSLI